MRSFNRSDGFDPLDLEIIDRVHEAAWAQLLARLPAVTEEEAAEREKNLRKRIFALARPGVVDFDTLFVKVMGSYDPPKVTPLGGERRGRSGSRTST
jgi:hypothetical protein